MGEFVTGLERHSATMLRRQFQVKQPRMDAGDVPRGELKQLDASW